MTPAPSRRHRLPAALLVAAALVGVEGFAWLGYGAVQVVLALGSGVVAGGAGRVAGVVVLAALFGALLLLVARGLLLARRWSRSPTVVAQVLIGLVGYYLVDATGTARVAGAVLVVVALAALVAVFVPASGRALLAEEPPDGTGPDG